MRILIKAECWANSASTITSLQPGEEHEVSDADGKLLIKAQTAIEVKQGRKNVPATD